MEHGFSMPIRRKRIGRQDHVKTLKLRKTQSNVDYKDDLSNRRRPTHNGESGGCSPVMLFPSSPSKMIDDDEVGIDIPTLPLSMQVMMGSQPILKRNSKPLTLSFPLLDILGDDLCVEDSQQSFETERESAIDHLKELLGLIKTIKHPLVRDVKEHVNNGSISLPSDVLSMLRCRPRLGCPAFKTPTEVPPLPECLLSLVLPEYQVNAAVQTGLPKACPCCAAGNSPSYAPSPSVMSSSSIMSTLSNSSSESE